MATCAARPQLAALQQRRPTTLAASLPHNCCPAVRARVRVSAALVPSTVVVEPASLNGASNGNGAPIPSPVAVTLPPQLPAVLAPPAVYQALLKVGSSKTQISVPKLLVSGFLAGCYIGFGAYLAMSIQGGLTGLATTLPGFFKLVGALVFPVGLTLVVMSGAELYTGNTAVVTMAVMEKQTSWRGLAYNWFWSYLGNFLGSLAMAGAVFAAGTLVGNPVPLAIAETKTSLPWVTAFVRAVLCNWLVCMAVWNASAAQSLPGKVMGLWPPIAAFVAIGLEHSVANMFFIPMGILLGAKVTFGQFLLNNLLPVTLGNTFAGVVFVALAFGIVHGNLGKGADKAPVPAAVAANN